MKEQVKSKQRVADYGEVFTSPEIVNAVRDGRLLTFRLHYGNHWRWCVKQP